jgi:transcription antitermination factor NusG
VTFMARACLHTRTAQNLQTATIVNHDEVKWFAVQVRAMHEKRVATLLEQKGFEHLLPVQTVRKRWSDRIKEVDQPLFPGYLICRFSMNTRTSILKTDGVKRVVGIGCVPVPIDDQEVLAIQRVVESGLEMKPHAFLSLGQRVRIETGPFDGIEGHVVGLRSRHRLVLAVSLLQRAISVEIDSAWVTAIPSLPPRPAARTSADSTYRTSASRSAVLSTGTLS